LKSAITIGVICTVVVLGLTFWVTWKAYSKKWDQEEQDLFD